MRDFQDIHTFVFLFLAIGLFLSVKFFVNELRNAQASGSISGAEAQSASASSTANDSKTAKRD
jgi:hypothetical protein